MGGENNQLNFSERTNRLLVVFAGISGSNMYVGLLIVK